MGRLLCILLLCAMPAGAQDYPEPQNIWVNDYADLLDAGQEADLIRSLQALREETGVEMTLLTIERVSQYAQDTSLETFATGLFNAWGIGDATRNDGILVLVARQDRAMRLELGSGYPRVWDDVAGNVVDDSFLPRFRADDYGGGIIEGSAAIIARIARPFAAGEKPDEQRGVFWLAIPAALGALGLIFRRFLADLWARVRRCPQCGHRGLKTRRKITRRATRNRNGQGRRNVWCPVCDYRDQSTYSIKRVISSSSSSFGGGSSSGGGASGRW